MGSTSRFGTGRFNRLITRQGHTHPPLTTMVLPNYEMGRAAVEALLAAADLPPPQRAARRHLIKIDCPLVARQTVRPR